MYNYDQDTCRLAHCHLLKSHIPRNILKLHISISFLYRISITRLYMSVYITVVLCTINNTDLRYHALYMLLSNRHMGLQRPTVCKSEEYEKVLSTFYLHIYVDVISCFCCWLVVSLVYTFVIPYIAIFHIFLRHSSFIRYCLYIQ